MKVILFLIVAGAFALACYWLIAPNIALHRARIARAEVDAQVHAIEEDIAGIQRDLEGFEQKQTEGALNQNQVRALHSAVGQSYVRLAELQRRLDETRLRQDDCGKALKAAVEASQNHWARVGRFVAGMSS